MLLSMVYGYTVHLDPSLEGNPPPTPKGLYTKKKNKGLARRERIHG